MMHGVQDHESYVKAVENSWDAEYLSKRRNEKRPISFVSRIIAYMNQKKNVRKGLYAGCGNGRNYIPLVKHGLDLDGLDISGEALSEIRTRLLRSNRNMHLIKQNFLNYYPNELYTYLIAIQVFQHGNMEMIRKYLEHSHAILTSNSPMFLRINSSSTKIIYKHEIVEQNDDGAYTIRYLEGPKNGLLISFLTEEELYRLCDELFIIEHISEVTMKRKKPKIGTWSQFEVILKKNV